MQWRLEDWFVKVFLSGLIIFQVILIANYYSPNFDNYIMVVMIVLTLPLAYFGYHYLSLLTKHTHFYQITTEHNYADSTEKEVSELTKSQAFLLHRENVEKGNESWGDEKDDEDIAAVMSELEDMEEYIFAEE